MNESKARWIDAASDPFTEEAENILATAEEHEPSAHLLKEERRALVRDCAAILENAWRTVEDKVNDAIEAKAAQA